MRASKGKRRKAGVVALLAILETGVLRLEREPRTGSDRPGRYRRIEIFDPWHRVVSGAAIRDRVVQHAWCASRSSNRPFTGSDRVQEIAAHVREDARVCINGQYTTVGIVGAVLVVALLLALEHRGGTCHRRRVPGAGRPYRHVRLRARPLQGSAGPAINPLINMINVAAWQAVAFL